MTVSISGEPPYSWYKGTDLTADFFWSRIFCEAMQALKNRVDKASVVISDWSAYKGNGNILSNLGQTPADLALDTAEGFRHVNQLLDLRTALEAVVGSYYKPYPDWDTAYTLASLMTAATGRADYNRTEGELLALGYFDKVDVGEILKCIDLLLFTGRSIVFTISGFLGIPGAIRHWTPGILVAGEWMQVVADTSHYTFTFPSTGGSTSFFENAGSPNETATKALKNGVPTVTHRTEFEQSAETEVGGSVFTWFDLDTGGEYPCVFSLRVRDDPAWQDHFAWGYKDLSGYHQIGIEYLGFSNMELCISVILEYTA